MGVFGNYLVGNRVVIQGDICINVVVVVLINSYVVIVFGDRVIIYSCSVNILCVGVVEC